MKVQLIPFQKKAVSDIRDKIAASLYEYKNTSIPQVVSFTAPTGSGKTIIMSAVIENIFFGDEKYTEQQDAIFVWLSDSPQLNEQSKQKIDLKADKIRLDQCVTITEESFDQEILENGHIYFLNTQKIGKSGNLCRRSDKRQHTIWETLNNTAREKSDRLYFIIDEAHRGMQGTQAGQATSIMQRFLKGSPNYGMSPMPVVIGMSATSKRFDKLIEGTTNSTLRRVAVTAAEVRSSGLLKDRIVIKYPESELKNNDMAILQAATDEWINKRQHWHEFCRTQHYGYVKPVFVIQVKKGTGGKISDTNLEDCLDKIEERCHHKFTENEVVHSFGMTGTIEINGLRIPHVDASEIAADTRIKIVFFKESLSTGWDCPRAETMMSFSHAEDPTYIAQLLGRMIRTPLQQRVLIDESLNDVHLYLPYFNEKTVTAIVEELQATEGGDIPTVIDSDTIEDPVFNSWGHRIQIRKNNLEENPNQGSLFVSDNQDVFVLEAENPPEVVTTLVNGGNTVTTRIYNPPTKTSIPIEEGQEEIPGLTIDRDGVIKAVNEMCLASYDVRSFQINSYFDSLLKLARFLNQSDIDSNVIVSIENDIVGMISVYVDELKKNNLYESYAKKVLEYKLLSKIYDPFGQQITNISDVDLFSSDADLDRQLNHADANIGNSGFAKAYMNRNYNEDRLQDLQIDVILFANDSENKENLNKYAKQAFHDLSNKYRQEVSRKEERFIKQYRQIVSNGDEVSKLMWILPDFAGHDDQNGEKYYNHLYVNEDSGYAKIELNSWEKKTLEEEIKRPDFVCWLRNVPRASWALSIPYEIESVNKLTYPDFIVFRHNEKQGYIVDILEPHNPAFKDNLGKAKAFAKYAGENIGIGRLQLIRMAKDGGGNNKLKRLELTDVAVQEKVLKAQTTDEIDHIFDTFGFFDK